VRELENEFGTRKKKEDMKPVRKAVFPVAGLGTRFLPATKAMPKEMLPVVDKPLIQYAVEEATAAGIRQMIFITGRHKRSIEDHFDRMPELEAELAAKGKDDLLAIVKDISPETDVFIYIRQPEPLGLGHAVLCAEPAVGDEPFAVILADDLIDAGQPGIGQLMQAREARGGGNVVAVEDVPREDTSRYGIVRSTAIDDRTSRVAHIVEKPAPADAPSTLAVLGRYVLEPGIFEHLRTIPRGSGGEIQLTDAIEQMVPAGTTYAYRYAGKRFDCGSKQGFLDATVHFARKAGYTI
jgi:UTP--glucose-1-phosphate uridylyltransferase